MKCFFICFRYKFIVSYRNLREQFCLFWVLGVTKSEVRKVSWPNPGLGLLSGKVFEHPYNSALRYSFAPDATPVSVSHGVPCSRLWLVFLMGDNVGRQGVHCDYIILLEQCGYLIDLICLYFVIFIFQEGWLVNNKWPESACAKWVDLTWPLAIYLTGDLPFPGWVIVWEEQFWSGTDKKKNCFVVVYYKKWSFRIFT